MQPLNLKPVEGKNVIVYAVKAATFDFTDKDVKNIVELARLKKMRFVTVDALEEFKEFEDSNLAKSLSEVNVPSYKVSVPDQILNILYQDVVEKDKLAELLIQEYTTMDETESIKGMSLRAWIVLQLSPKACEKLCSAL